MLPNDPSTLRFKRPVVERVPLSLHYMLMGHILPGPTELKAYRVTVPAWWTSVDAWCIFTFRSAGDEKADQARAMSHMLRAVAEDRMHHLARN